MDFADLDLKTASEAGLWLHVKHPTTGDELYLDASGGIVFGDDIIGRDNLSPSRVHLKGMGDPKIFELIRRIERIGKVTEQKVQRAKPEQLDDIYKREQDESQACMRDIISLAVFEWENIVFGGEVLEPTTDNKLKVFGPGTLFFVQVYESLMEHTGFLKSAAQGS